MIEHEKRIIEKQLFSLFVENEGFDLYENILPLIESILQKHMSVELYGREEFRTRMMDWVNNYGWDDKSKWNARIDMIRNEADIIESIAADYGVRNWI